MSRKYSLSLSLSLSISLPLDYASLLDPSKKVFFSLERRENKALPYKAQAYFNILFVGKSYLQLIKLTQERWIT